MTLRHFPHRLSDTRAPQVGIVVLQSDESIEPEFRRLLPPALEVLVSRIPSGEDVTPETLAAMEHDLSDAAGLMPRGARFAALAYACTSGAAQIGPAKVATLLRAATDAPAVTDPVSALRAACRALDVGRLALLTPYRADVSERLCAVLAASGLAVATVGTFDIASEARVARIAPDAILHAATELVAGSGAEALFLSCTNLRTLDVIAPLEASLGLPVLSSNLVLGWHLARLAGVSGPGGVPSRLWERNI